MYTNNQIKHLYNFLGNIQDAKLHQEFLQSNFLQTPAINFFFISIVYTALMLPIQIIDLKVHIQKKHIHDDEYSFAVLGLIGCFFATIFSWLLTLIKLKYQDKYHHYMSLLQRLLMFSSLLFQIFRYLQINVVSGCDGGEGFSKAFICGNIRNSGVSMSMLAAPILLITVIHEYNFTFNLLYLLSSAAVFFGGSIFRRDPSLSLLIVLFTLGGCLQLYNLQIQSVSMFLLNKTLRDTLDENEKNADKVHADEMRHMIANVAHDLKTPLTSFMTGMDLIYHIVSECDNKMCSPADINPQSFSDSIAAIQQCLDNVRNTNTFMLMTINRCLDYTKASKGMKLVPRYETINLLETLSLPLDCMKNIQNRIQIILQPFPSNINKHIITDLQWLQENILCLLSNAVKYSTEGNVLINVCLIHTSALPETLMIDDSNVLSIKSAASPRTSFFKGKKSRKSSYEKGNGNGSQIYPSETQDILHLRFEIEDTGIGMSDEAMSSLFNPFKQAQRLAGGTGLGLYSLAKRVEALNGKYGVRRRRDGQKGSLFWFSIPYRPDDTFDTASVHHQNSVVDKHDPSAKTVTSRQWDIPVHISDSNDDLSSTNINSPDIDSISKIHNSNSQISIHIPSTPKVTQKVTSKVSWKILLVDDSPTILKMTSMLLKKNGHVVMTAENGEEALRLLEPQCLQCKMEFDLLLIDLQMPVMDGLETINRLRSMEKEVSLTSPSTPLHNNIIGFSANSDHETMQAAFVAGADSFISKPFKIEAFFQIANTLIRK